jgi:hypothetical protein
VANLDPAQRHDLAQVAQGQPVAQPAEHHEGNDVARQRGPVQHAATALVELPAAVPAAEAAIAARRHLSPLRHRHGLTPHAVHLDTPPAVTLPILRRAPKTPQIARRHEG